MALEVTQKLQTMIDDYAAHHKNPVNQWCHFVGLPVILSTTLGLLAQLKMGATPELQDGFFRLDGGVVLWVLGVLWYLWADWKIAIPFAFCCFGLYLVARAVPMPFLWVFWVAGWIIQFVGHGVYEKNRPAFAKNIQHLLVGPLWMFVKAVGYGR